MRCAGRVRQGSSELLADTYYKGEAGLGAEQLYGGTSMLVRFWPCDHAASPGPQNAYVRAGRARRRYRHTTHGRVKSHMHVWATQDTYQLGQGVRSLAVEVARAHTGQHGRRRAQGCGPCRVRAQRHKADEPKSEHYRDVGKADHTTTQSRCVCVCVCVCVCLGGT